MDRRRSSAAFDPAGALSLERRHPRDGMRPWIVGTVTPRQPRIAGLDLVRIDAARATLRSLAALRDQQEVEVLLDLPGPQTRRGSSPLTTSEFLVFAAAEGFPWVGLRGVGGAAALHRARPFLPAATQLAATISSPRALAEEIDAIADAADAILLDMVGLARRHSGDLRPLFQGAIRAASHRGKRCLLTNGVLPSLLDSSQPAPGEMSRLAGFLEDGGAGFVLVDEILRGEHPTTCVELLGLLTGRDRVGGSTRRRGAVQDGRAVLLHEIPYLDPTPLPL